MAAAIDQESVLAALRTVIDPAHGTDIVAAGMVKGLTISGTAVGFSIEVEPERGPSLEPLRKAAAAAAEGVAGVESATVVLTAHSETPGSAPAPKPPPNLRDAPGNPLPHPPRQSGPIEGVNRLIAVASGKGGVGKSTVTTNLALALARRGRKVGILDADIYGPSQPRMLGVSGRPSTPDGETILPLRNHGITVMSMGFMLEEDQSVVWRGPMLMSALQQMLRQVQWGQLDELIVDLPPGTGDVQLTLCQRAEVTGAVVVSTPQEVALLDVRKAIDMFKKLNIPVLGIIENMSGFVCPHCGKASDIFGHGGAKDEAAQLGIPFLGTIPIDPEIRTTSDAGTPLVIVKPDSAQTASFLQIADQLLPTD